MPIIDGYDDLDLGPKRFPEGEYTGNITGAKHKTGTTQNGDAYSALDITVSDDQYGETVRVFLPRSNADWQGWEDWQRKRCKKQLVALGIPISDVENESARAALIGKQIGLYVAKKQNGNGNNVYFQEPASKDAAPELPAPPVVAVASSANEPIVV